MKLVLRADGDARIGTGHVMRMLALAQAWNRHGSTVLVARSLARPLVDRARALGIEVVQPLQDAAVPALPEGQEDGVLFEEVVRSTRAKAVVVDGYHLPPHLQRVQGAPVFVVDDHGRTGWHGATGIIDGNLGAAPQNYPDVPALIGPRYALLRPSFLPVPPTTRPARSVIVSLGGGAAPDIVRTVLEGLRAVRPCDVTLVLGPTQEQAETLAAEASSAGFTVARDVPDLAPLLVSHACALVAAGTTVLEAAAAGTPLLAVAQADNQRPVMERVVEAGVGRRLGEATALTARDVARAVEEAWADTAWRGEASVQARQLVDGRGARRVCAWIRSHTLLLRHAAESDKEQVLAWANDPVTRSMSFRAETIGAAEHERWWARTMEDRDVLAFVAEQEGPIGFVWLRREVRQATISVNIAPTRRGAGWGPAVIRAATDHVLRSGWTAEVLAWTRPENVASRGAFLDADFDPVADPPAPPNPGALLFKRTMAAQPRADPGTRDRP